MPPDQQCFDILLQIDIGEPVGRLRHCAQVAAKIVASMGVEPARARVNVNINGAHEHFL
jgi:hypothetical protein